jgi:hypothetical protein
MSGKYENVRENEKEIGERAKHAIGGKFRLEKQCRCANVGPALRLLEKPESYNLYRELSDRCA